MFVAAVVLLGGYFFITKDTSTAPSTAASSSVTPAAVNTVNEFTMTAYYDEKGVWYSLKDMTVKKGEMVRVTITNTKGVHNFTIDELGIEKDLPLNENVVVEFTADKAGDFVYYCSMPGHRAKGQWGTLHVTE